MWPLSVVEKPGGGGARQLVTWYPPSGSREGQAPCPAQSPFYPVFDPSPLDGATHTESGPSLFRQPSLRIPSQGNLWLLVTSCLFGVLCLCVCLFVSLFYYVCLCLSLHEILSQRKATAVPFGFKGSVQYTGNAQFTFMEKRERLLST